MGYLDDALALRIGLDGCGAGRYRSAWRDRVTELVEARATTSRCSAPSLGAMTYQAFPAARLRHREVEVQGPRATIS